MSLLPIVERELRVAAKRPGTGYGRMAGALVASAVMAEVLVFGAMHPSPISIGRSLFDHLSGLLVLFCFFEGIRAASDTLSAERRNGTLGLLFLTDLRGHDIVLGKVIAVVAQILGWTFAAVPVLALGILLGGVTVSELARTALGLLNALAAAVALGTLVSAFSIQARSALAWGFGLLIALVVAPLALSALCRPVAPAWVVAILQAASPLLPFLLSDARSYAGNPAGYWGSLAWSACFVVLCLGIAAWRAPRLVTEGAGRGQDPARIRRARTRRVRWVPPALRDEDPVAWLWLRGSARGWVGGAIAAVLSLAVPVAAYYAEVEMTIVGVVASIAGMLLGWAVKIGMATQLARELADPDQREGWGLLLVTPLRDREILKGWFHAYGRAWLGPLLWLYTLELIALSFSWMSSAFYGAASVLPTAVGALGAAWASLAAIVFGLLTLTLDLLAIFWMGTWLSLTSRSTNAAALKTLLFVQVLPALFCCGLRFIPDLVFWLWARDRLNRDLRGIVQKPTRAG